MPIVLALLFLAAIGIIVGIGMRWRRQKAEQRTLNGRGSMNEDAIYSNYYANSGLQKGPVLELWNEIATTLKVPPDRLRPTDRFGKEIGSYSITSEDLDTLFERAQTRARRAQSAVDFGKITTVDEYIRTLAAHL